MELGRSESLVVEQGRARAGLHRKYLCIYWSRGPDMHEINDDEIGDIQTCLNCLLEYV